MEIRRVRINPCRTQKIKKKNVSFVHPFIIFLEKLKIFLKPYPFACLIKGTILGWMLWGANTFFTHN